MEQPTWFTIRRLVTDDWDCLRDIRLAALKDAPEAFGSTLEREEAFEEETWRSRCETGSNYAAFPEGDAPTPIGMATHIWPEEWEEPELVAMWVAPSARRRTVATHLVRAVVEHARQVGAPALRLWVAEGNERARALYESEGFVATGVTQPLPSRPELIEEEMRLSL